MAAVMRKQKLEDADIKKLAEYAHLSYSSAKSLYHMVKKLQPDLLTGMLLGDVESIAQAKENFNYYGKPRVHNPDEPPEDVHNFQQTVEDVSLIVWAFKKIGDKERIEAAVKTALSMFKKK